MAASVSIDDIRAAAHRLSGVAVQTPLIENERLNAEVDGRVFVKAECLQRTGSFKFRGAYNLISQLSPAARARGVVAWSSGNHGKGVAAAAKALGAPATLIMPKDAPAVKIRDARADGAKIIFYDRDTEDREEIGRRLSGETGATLAPSYDHPDVIAGQGTVGLEIADAVAGGGERLDAVIICCGGGGLTSGVAIAVKQSFPNADIIIVEPEGFDDVARSLKAGRRLGNAPGGRSLCDALMTPSPGALTFPILQNYVTAAHSVTDADALSTMAFAFDALKLAVEPGGAAALAALLAGHYDCRGKTVAAIVSGGNVDPAVFRQALDPSDHGSSP